MTSGASFIDLVDSAYKLCKGIRLPWILRRISNYITTTQMSSHAAAPSHWRLNETSVGRAAAANFPGPNGTHGSISTWENLIGGEHPTHGLILKYFSGNKILKTNARFEFQIILSGTPRAQLDRVTACRTVIAYVMLASVTGTTIPTLNPIYKQ